MQLHLTDPAKLVAFGAIALLLLLAALTNIFTLLQAIVLWAAFCLASVKTEKGVAK